MIDCPHHPQPGELRAAFDRMLERVEFRAPANPDPDPPIWFWVDGRYMRAAEFRERYGQAAPDHWQHEGATPED